MNYLPFFCIPVLVLLYLGTFYVTAQMGQQILRRYFRGARRLCQEQGLAIDDDPDQPERFVINGVLEGIPLRVSTARIEFNDKFNDPTYRQVQRVELGASASPSWVTHTPLRTSVEKRIIAPPVPDVGPRVVTGDENFDRKLELFVAGGQLPAFARTGWLRRVLLESHVQLGVSHESRTLVDFLELEFRDARFDLHLLRRRILSALVLSDPERMTRHRDFLVQRPPPIVNWSRVPLIALFLSLPAAVAGQHLLAYPEPWMGAVVGAAAGYPAGLLCALVATGLWTRRARRRAAP